MTSGNEKINILIVDDEKYICSIIIEALASEKYNTVSTSDPSEALEYVKTHPVDLVLTDLVMGEYSGVQILETTLEHHEDVAVILMTAHPTVQTAISVLKKGAYDFLIKPFKLELLRATIRRALGHQRVVRENLQLKGQVEFLKVSNSIGSETGLEECLELVAQSCQNELSAEAVGIIEIDHQSREIVRKVVISQNKKFHQQVLDESTLDKFINSRSSRPLIESENFTKRSGQEFHRIFISQPIRNRTKLQGVINLLIETRFGRITPGKIDVLTLLANSAASTIANFRLYRDVKQSYLQAIRALAKAIEARDEYTAGHTDRVSKLAEAVVREMGWNEDQIDDLLMGCTLHDIGKIAIPDNVLNKPGRLTDAERKQMNNHPRLGLKIIQGIDLFKKAVPYIKSHHECFDGSGYPQGLSGEDIPIEGRLLAVADTFDAIITDRPYRKGADLAVAVAELVKFRNIQFDPDLVDLFLEVLVDGKIDLEKLYGRKFDLSVVAKIQATETVSV